MDRSELELLQSVHDYPSLSILMPTYRSTPEDRQNAIRLKNLVAQATESLLSSFPRQEIDPLLKRLEALLVQVDQRRVSDGLALFVNGDVARLFYLPFVPRERFVLDASFATGELLEFLDSSPRYWVLVLDGRSSKLFEGWRDTLTPMNRRFLVSGRKESNTRPLPIGYGIEKSKHRAERDRQFVRQVDAALGQMTAAEPLPLVVVGTERYLAYFGKVSRHNHRVVATLAGNHARTPARELAKLVWPLVRSHLALPEESVRRGLEGERMATPSNIVEVLPSPA
jgi:hypothetical protein